MHKGHDEWAPHVGACIAATEEAMNYGGDTVYTVTLDLTGLVVVEVEYNDYWRALRDDVIYPGDADDGRDWTGVDVLIYQDEDLFGRQHDTFRLMSLKAQRQATFEIKDEE